LAAAAEGDTETQILIGVAALAIFKVGHARQAKPGRVISVLFCHIARRSRQQGASRV